MRLKSGIFVDSRAEKCACVSEGGGVLGFVCGSIFGEWTRARERSGHSAAEICTRITSIERV